MKHLFILISFLLLSSPVISKGTLPVSGGKGETLYEWKTSIDVQCHTHPDIIGNVIQCGVETRILGT